MASAQEYINDKRVQRLMEQVDADAQEAYSQYKRNIGNEQLKEFKSSSFLTSYKKDGQSLDKAIGDFNKEWNLVAFGKSKDLKKLIAAYSRYVLILTMVEEQNNRFSAVIEAKLATIGASFIALIVGLREALQKRAELLAKELAELAKMLEQAKKDVIGAEAQRVLNIAVSVVSLALGPATLTARVLVAAGGFASHTLIDAALGPSRGSALGTANTAAGELATVSKDLSRAESRLLGVASDIITLKLDGDEVDDARKILDRIKKRIKSASQAYSSITKNLASGSKNIAQAYKSLDAAIAGIKKADSKFKASTREYEKLKTELKKWKKK